MRQYRDYLQYAVQYVLKDLKPPLSDGQHHKGELKFMVNRFGRITKVLLTKTSGHAAFDKAVFQAVLQSSAIPVPNDHCLAKLFYLAPLVLSYDEADMAD